MAKPKKPGINKPGEPAKRGRKPKRKPKPISTEPRVQHTDNEVGHQDLSGLSASAVTSPLGGVLNNGGSVEATERPQKVPSPVQNSDIKGKADQSKTAGLSGGSRKKKVGSKKMSKKSKGGPTLVQSRLAWKTMAQPAVPADMLKTLDAEQKISVENTDLNCLLPAKPKLPQKPKVPVKPQAVKRRKRKLGLYSFVPKKKSKASAKQNPTIATLNSPNEVLQGGKGVQVPLEKAFKPRKNGGRKKRQHGRAAGGDEVEMQERNKCGDAAGRLCEEYTELPLHTLAQESVLTSVHTGSPAEKEHVEGDVDMLEPPLCCCRMEAPRNQDVVTLAEGKCMAMESVDGKMISCRKPIQKQEMMRPSLLIPLLILCEDHRAGMVKHQCCPGCGIFCRVGAFMECQPDSLSSHRFHQSCASKMRGQIFCPHCGEEASQAKEVTLPKASLVRATSPVLTVAPPNKKTHSVGNSEGELILPRELVKPVESVEISMETLKDKTCHRSKHLPKQLYFSAKSGELQQVMQMLVEGVDPNLQLESDRRRTALHAAAAEGHTEICHILVQAGAHLDVCDDQQRTPLMDACENKHVGTVEYLLKAGASTIHKDERGSTCLHIVSRGGHTGIMQHLLSSAFIDINCKDDGGWTPITWATENMHREQVKLLIARGADIHIRDKEENICLHWAAFAGCVDVAQLLLENRSDLHAVNIHADSPLHIAVRQNQLDCVMLFLSRGADVNMKNKDGETPLDCCSVNSKVWSILNTSKKLLDARRGRDRQGEKLLCRDLSRGYEEIPVTCVNGVDQTPCPNDFKYIPENCYTTQVNIDENITHLQHCTCKDDCSSSSCICGQLSTRCWYDREGRLLKDFSSEDPPFLFECNHACTCWRTCRNRVVQNRLRVRLQVFRTARMGWGVRALQDIPEGSFICEFAGEIISDGEANVRENDSYLFNLENKVGEIYCIDAQFYGNVSRFMNHLCEPNLFPVRVFTKHQDLRFPRIALFACKPIRSGDELGFDYGDQYWEIKRKYFSCKCDSAKCRHSGAALGSGHVDSSAQTPTVVRSPAQVASTERVHSASTARTASQPREPQQTLE